MTRCCIVENCERAHARSSGAILPRIGASDKHPRSKTLSSLPLSLVNPIVNRPTSLPLPSPKKKREKRNRKEPMRHCRCCRRPRRGFRAGLTSNNPARTAITGTVSGAPPRMQSVLLPDTVESRFDSRGRGIEAVPILRDRLTRQYRHSSVHTSVRNINHGDLTLPLPPPTLSLSLSLSLSVRAPTFESSPIAPCTYLN